MFDAWLTRCMKPNDRILNVLRARFWLSLWHDHIVHLADQYPDLYSLARSFISSQSFHIFNRLCDSMILLVLAYAKFYPNCPFCPWLFGTEFIKHFFGLARMLLPDFTYAELVKMTQNMMVCQHLLLMDNFREKREKASAAGYVTEYDPSPLTPDETRYACVSITLQDLNLLIELSFREASQICKQILHLRILNLDDRQIRLMAVGAPQTGKKHHQVLQDFDGSGSEPDNDMQDSQDSSISDDDNNNNANLPLATPESAASDVIVYSALCDDYEAGIQESLSHQLPQSIVNTNVNLPPLPSASCSKTFRSIILSDEGKVSIDLMVLAREQWQSHTAVVMVSPFN